MIPLSFKRHRGNRPESHKIYDTAPYYLGYLLMIPLSFKRHRGRRQNLIDHRQI